MKTLVRPATLQLFIAFGLGVTLAACQPAIIAPDSQLESVHIVKKTHGLDSLSHKLSQLGALSSDSVAIDPQPRTLPKTYELPI